MARIFLSHSSKDKEFVRRLAASLKNLKHTVWLDEWEIRVGDSIPAKIEGGLEHADFVAVILSKNSTKSKWVENEWQAKYWDEVNRKRIMVLPILLDDCGIPPLLRPKKYADFRTDYETGLINVVLSLQPRGEISGVAKYYADFVDITDDWLELFRESATLDLLMMYSSTWRNTYLKYLREMLSRHESQLRVVVPDLRTGTPLARVYSDRLDVSAAELRRRIETSVSEFSDLSKHGHVEIYSTGTYLNHSFYLFDAGGILALYAYQKDRVPTPAFLLREGALTSFLRQDFHWLTSPRNPTRRLLHRGRPIKPPRSKR